MKRQRDEFGYPIVSNDEWKAGITPEDVRNEEMFWLVAKVVGVVAVIGILVYFL